MSDNKRIYWEGASIAPDSDRIKQCKHCNQNIVWLMSKRTGNYYPVNKVDGVTDVARNDFHKCEQEPIVKPRE